MMKLLNQVLYRCYQVIQAIGAVVLSAILLIVTAGILSRYLLNSPFSWTEEVTTFLMVYLCYISAALTTVQKKHIVADFFITKAPEKFQRAVSMFSRILIIVFFSVVCFSILKLLPQLTWKSAVLEIPRQYYYLPVITMSAFMIFAVVVDILNSLFPGYDIMAEINRKHDEAEKAAEQQEAAAMQKNMDAFLENSGAGASSDGTQVKK